MAAANALYILTGASRGMGAAMADQLLVAGNTLLCISRKLRGGLEAQAKAKDAHCEQWAMDLATPQPVAERLSQWLASLDAGSFSQASLINNAGVLSRLGPLGETNPAELSNALRVGLEAPVLLTATFLRDTQAWAAQRRVLNISSGLGRRAMAGSASYCAAKAGMDHFSRAVALEEAARSNGAKVVSLAPGVIDTGMQTQLRDSDPAGFPDRENFVQLQAKGQLTSPQDAAARVLAYLNRPDFGNTTVADVRDA
jgi:NAD(P)-dependent dehydrogenase (short-subunit alcohol dehydrogenase family)